MRDSGNVPDGFWAGFAFSNYEVFGEIDFDRL